MFQYFLSNKIINILIIQHYLTNTYSKILRDIQAC
jgi:hypothetical protein